MKLIRPTTINDARLVSSTVPETDYGVWEPDVAYWLGARIIKAHRIWESSQASNLNHDPQTAGIAWWVDMGPTNRWGMFDDKVGTVSSATETMTVTLAPGRADSLALLQVDAAEVTVTQRVGATIITQRVIPMVETDGIENWFDYFFDPIRRTDFVTITDLPVYGESTIEITFDKNAGTVSCGICVVGLQSYLGETLASPSVGISDYSKKTIDEFGNASLTQRSFAKRIGARLIVQNADLDRVRAVLSAVRATPLVWIGSDQYSSMTVYGWYRDFEIDIAHKPFSYCTLNIEGMI